MLEYLREGVTLAQPEVLQPEVLRTPARKTAGTARRLGPQKATLMGSCHPPEVEGWKQGYHT